MDNIKLLQDKVIIVTGASCGLGREVALAYAREGATVVLIGRNADTLEEVYDEVLSYQCPEPFAVTLDLSSATEAEFEQLVQSINKAIGRLDGVVHCAGSFYTLSPLICQTVEEWINQYRVNTVAPMALTTACLPLLQDSPDASVLFVGESHAQTPKAYWGAYGASFVSLNYLCRVAADEWQNFHNLRVNLIEPGAIASAAREKTHPGESMCERKDISDVIPDFIYWMSEESAGKSGRIISL